VVEDVVLALIESRDPKQYIQRMKQRDPELGKGWVQIVRTLSIPTEGGPQPMLCASTEGLFRVIQTIPSQVPGFVFGTLLTSPTRRRRTLCQPRATPWVTDK
jgi:hypothetical protein